MVVFFILTNQKEVLPYCCFCVVTINPLVVSSREKIKDEKKKKINKFEIGASIFNNYYLFDTQRKGE